MLKKVLRTLPYALTAAVFIGALFFALQRDQVLDWWHLRGYDPPAAIAALADDTAMADHARNFFYVNKPTLDDREEFNNNCAGVIHEVAVLGCYLGDRHGIHIYKIDDDRWHGMKEVTAAHEMLHQAYDRLSEDERWRINELLLDFHENGQYDQDIRDKIELYSSQGWDVVVNEMHSIFGTEAADLPDELEEYYSQYFTDRTKVLAFRASSWAAFNDYRSQIAGFDRRLAELKTRIDANQDLLSAQLRNLEERREQMEADLDADRVEQYNAAVPGFNAAVDEYNSLLSRTRSLVGEHNDIVRQRNAVAIVAEDLNAALDSRLTPQ